MSASATATERPNTQEMVIVHNVFRRHFGAVPALVRGVRAGDLPRAQRLVEFLTELTDGLHHHHTTEDEMMWPMLLDRAPTDSALVLRMEEQHERIAELIGRSERQREEFAATADPEAGQRLATTLDALASVLDQHMSEEERDILPVVEQVMSVPEWKAIGERGGENMPKNRQLVFLGYLLQGVPAADHRLFLTQLPLAARIAWRVLGRRAFSKEYREIYGTDPS